MRSRAWLLPIPLVLASALLAQTTHVVTGGGPALRLAIAAAAPGDAFDVQAGSYEAVTVTRAARILLRAGAQVAGPYGQGIPGLTVTGLPQPEAVVVTGGSVEGIALLSSSGAVVLDSVQFDSPTFAQSTIQTCTGPVVVTGATVPLPTSYSTLAITGSSQVSFTDSALPRLVVTNSHVALSNTTLVPYGGTWPPGGRPSLRIVSGSVCVTGGQLRGGVAASWPFTESAIRLEQGELVLTGSALVQESSPILAAVPAIDSVGGSIRIDPGVTLLGNPPIAGPAVATFATVPAVVRSRSPGSSTFQVTVLAAPSSLSFTLIALPTQVATSPFGPLWLRPDSPILDVGIVPATGLHAFQRTLHGVPPYLALTLQSATLGPNGAIAVGAPLRFVWD